ncbi:MAG: hypothetical protein U0736_12390 [Gemmataceae bacterium]
MSANATPPAGGSAAALAVPLPVLVVLRGVGQVFFQDNALTGAVRPGDRGSAPR